MSREVTMVREYGEAVTKTAACRIIHVSKSTLYRLISEKRVALACGGTRIDVRSLAEYIDRPPDRSWWFIPKGE